jgi:ferredoxin
MIGRRSRANGFVVTVSVDNNHCHLFAICEQEAPEVFTLGRTRLHVATRPEPHLIDKAKAAARLCPMQAITVREIK